MILYSFWISLVLALFVIIYAVRKKSQAGNHSHFDDDGSGDDGGFDGGGFDGGGFDGGGFDGGGGGD